MLPTSPVRRPHVPALDGLRGLAILMVFLHHTIVFPDSGYNFAVGAVQFGRFGVDLFFCLSGFLITGILVAAKGHDNYFRNFYARRALRIFPLYYTYLFVYWLLVVHLHVVRFGSEKIALTAHDLHWAWFYGTNLLIARQWHFSHASSIGHFWTLAIEEQFYLFWPLIVFWLSPRRLLHMASLAVIGSLILRVVLHSHGIPELVIRTSTICRLDTFALGGAAALLLDSEAFRQRARRLVVPAMIPLLLAGSVLFYTSEPLFVGIGFTSLALFSTLLIITVVIFADSSKTSFLRTKSMRLLGKYSYAIYIFHVPIQKIMMHKLPLARIAARTHSIFLPILLDVFVVAVVTLLVAMTSWNLLEKRALAYKRFFPEPNSRLGKLPSIEMSA